MAKDENEKICYRNYCEEKENIKKCKYCEQPFCKKHIKPFPPHTGLNQGHNRHEGDEGHPCPPYVTHLEKEEKKKEEEYRKNLNALLDKNKNVKPIKNGIYTKTHHKETLYIDDENINTPKKNRIKNRTSQKKEKRKKYLLISIIIAIILIILLTQTKIIQSITNNPKTENKNSILDEKTIKAFSYVNKFREKHNLPEFIYSEQLYPYIKDATKAKDASPNLFRTSKEFEELIQYYVDTSLISKSYYKTYFIGGGGLEQFYKEFDKSYGTKNIIKDKNYNRGAIYCELDYCLLYIFNRPKITL